MPRSRAPLDGGLALFQAPDPGRAWWGDAGIYAGSAAFALIASRWWSNPLQREWASGATLVYGSAAVLTCAAATLAPRLPRRSHLGPRTMVLVAVLVGTALLPLVSNVLARDGSGPATHAQSETIVIEEAAIHTLQGRDPYVEENLAGPLRSWPVGTRTHFPYLPGMIAFGIPRAVAGDHPAADARVWLAAASLLVALLALWLARPDRKAALRGIQLSLALPIGAATLAGGGDDVLVIALILLALSLVVRRRPVWAGLAMGVAAAMKQTAWPVLPFVLLAARRPDGEGARNQCAAVALGVAIAVIGPFALRDQAHFLDDVVSFPLGLAGTPTLADGPTLGRLLRDAFPSAGGAIAIFGMALVGATATYLALRRPARTAAEAATHGAIVVTAAVFAATAGRFGYLLYPVALLAWGVFILSGSCQQDVVESRDHGGVPSLRPAKADGVVLPGGN